MNIVQRYEQAWLDAKALHDQMVAQAFVDKRPLPDNYWQAEHAARVKMETVQRLYPVLLEALREEMNGQANVDGQANGSANTIDG